MTTLPASMPAAPRTDQAARLRALFGSSAGPGGARRARVVAVASGKGGVGKTNIAVNLSIALAQGGVAATLLDADLGVANADVLCGLNPSARIDHAMAGGKGIDEIAIEAPGGFRLVPGAVGLSRLAELSPGERAWLTARLGELEAAAGVIVIDSPAGVGSTVMAMSQAADLTLVVVTPEPTAIADAYALLKCLRAEARASGVEMPTVALVVNQARDGYEAAQTHARIDAASRRFLGATAPLIGWVAADAAVPASVRGRWPVLLSAPECAASGCVRTLARSVGGKLGVTVNERPAPRARSWWARWRGGAKA